MPQYRATYSNANEIRFADPGAFQNTLIIKNNTQPKKAGSRTVYNAQSAMNIQRTVVLDDLAGCKDACVTDSEKLSLRFSLSGSTASSDEKLSLISDFISWLETAKADLVAGFLPTAGAIFKATDTESSKA